MFIHSQKRNPQTHLKDPNMVWDFFVNHPMVTHQVNRNNFRIEQRNMYNKDENSFDMKRSD